MQEMTDISTNINRVFGLTFGLHDNILRMIPIIIIIMVTILDQVEWRLT